MRPTFLLVMMLLVYYCIAQTPNTLVKYENELNLSLKKDKVIVVMDNRLFDDNIQVVLNHPIVGKSYQIPSLNLLVVYPKKGIKDINQFYSIKSKLEQLANVNAVMPFLKTKTGGFYGVLPKVYFKWKKESVTNLFSNSPFAESIIEPYKYNSNIFVIETSEALELAIWLNKQESISWAEPGYLLSPKVTSDDPLYRRQWAHFNEGTPVQFNGLVDADMDVDSAWTITRGDSTIKVAVLDSGVDTAHTDLFGNLLGGFDAVDNITKGYPTPNYDNDGHGTACAGIIAAIADNGIGVAGVAPECKIMPIRVFYYVDTLGLGVIPYSTAEWFSDAINWAWQNGADIMSNSWGLDDLTLQLLPGNPAIVEDAIQQALIYGRDGKGTAQFFSSGNEDTPPIWPSKLHYTIAVNATSMCDERKFNGSCDGEPWTGCWGEPLDFSAPGVKISTTDMMGGNGYSGANYYNYFNGTSAACPNAAAVGALLLSVNPDLIYSDIQYIIARTAEKVGGYVYDVSKNQGMWSDEMGFGRVNAYQALLYAQNYNVGIKETEIADFKLFPNPTQHYINVQCSADCGTIKIYDIMGKIVLEKSTTSSTYNLNLSHLTKGLYFAEVNGKIKRVLIY